MPRNLSSRTQALVSEYLTRPTYLIELGFDSPVRITSGPITVWDNKTWTPSLVAANGVELQDTTDGAQTGRLTLLDVGVSALIAQEGAAGRECVIWQYWAKRLPSVGDPDELERALSDVWRPGFPDDPGPLTLDDYASIGGFSPYYSSVVGGGFAPGPLSFGDFVFEAPGNSDPVERFRGQMDSVKIDDNVEISLRTDAAFADIAPHLYLSEFLGTAMTPAGTRIEWNGETWILEPSPE